MRVPRLCQMYHKQIKGLTESETGTILDKIYTEWFAAKAGSTPSPRLDETEKTLNALGDARPLSKIEEALIDLSVK